MAGHHDQTRGALWKHPKQASLDCAYTHMLLLATGMTVGKTHSFDNQLAYLPRRQLRTKELRGQKFGYK